MNVCLAALLVALVPQDSRPIQFTVEAGAHDRAHTPVRIFVTLPPAVAKASAVTIKGSDGTTLTGQISDPSMSSPVYCVKEWGRTRELTFVVPALKAGQEVTYTGALSSGSTPAAGGFKWTEKGRESIDLSFDGKPVLRYMCAPLDESSKEAREQTYKVFHHLFDPSGSRPVTKGPGGKFTHHRGIFYGFNKVTYGAGKACDIWHCTGTAYQEHVKLLSSEEGPVFGRHRLEIAWHGAGREVFALEERELTAWRMPAGTLVQFVSRLKPVIAPLKLDGDPQHAGFHFRSDNEVADKTAKLTTYVRPDGPGKPGETRNWDAKNSAHKNLPWDAMSFVLGEKRYTVAYLDRPENPKEARFSERDYGRFGSYFVHTLEKDQSLTVAYRLWLQEGEMTIDQVAAKSADFTSPPEATYK